MTTNRHHPDFHANPNDMSDVDLIEMVCDWTAMAQEFGEDSGMPADGRTRRSVSEWPLTGRSGQFIYQVIDELDGQIAANPKQKLSIKSANRVAVACAIASTS